MPSYTLLLFGICRDLLASDHLTLQTTEKLSANALLAQVKTAHPALAKLPSLRLAADHHFPEPDFILEESMEIALIPPVSGG